MSDPKPQISHGYALSLLWLGLLAVYVQVFRLPYFISEQAQFYDMNVGMGWGDTLAAYNPFVSGWYRPSAFFLSYKLLAPLVGWHNIWGWQLVSVVGVGLLATTVYCFALRLPGFTRSLALFGALAAGIHPVLFMIPADIIYFDVGYQIFGLLAMLLALSGMQNDSPRKLWGAFALFVFSLTWKEQALAFGGGLAAVVAFEWVRQRGLPRTLRLHALSMGVASLVLALAFALVRAVSQGSMSGEYNNSVSLSVIGGNLPALAWPFRIFAASTPSWGGIDNLFHPLAAFVGVAIAVLVLVYLLGLSRQGRDERLTALLLLVLLAGFSVLPVMSGGRPWHFALPAVFVMLLLALAFRALARGLQVGERGILVGAMLLLLALSIHDFEIDRRRRFSMNRINLSALQDPPLPASALPHGATIAYEAPGTWAYGNGYLFEWVYLRPDIRDLQFESLKDISPEQARALLGTPDLFFFRWHEAAGEWSEDTAQFREFLELLTGNGAFSLTDGRIDFSDAGNSAAFLREGWSGQEAHGRWSDGESASLAIPVGDYSGEVKVRAAIHSFASEQVPELPIEVVVEGETLLRHTFEGSGGRNDAILEFTVPGHLIEGRERIDLRFRILHPQRPSDHFDSMDSRLLGIYPLWMEFKAAADPAE